MSMSQTLNEKVVPVVMKFVNLKGIQALKDGVLYTIPLQIIGSLFLLIACFPVKAFTDFMTATFGAGWTDPLFKVQDGTMSIMALVSVIGIAYIYAKNEGFEPLSAGVMSLAVFLITTTNLVMFTNQHQMQSQCISSWRSYSKRLDWWQRYDYCNYNWFSCWCYLFMVYEERY